MPWLELPSARLYYETTGEGPDLVFAHGLGGNHMSWWQQVPEFSKRYRCTTFAHRGFAPSTQAEGGPGATAFADDLDALLDTIGAQEVRLVAQSMGGWTCLEWTLRNPVRVKALVMCDTTGTLAHPDFAPIWAAQMAAGRERPLFERHIHPAAGERMAAEQPELHHLYWLINDLASGLDKDALRRQLGEMRARPVEALAAVTMPVLCVAGEEDIVIPPETVRIMAEALPNGRFAPVPRAGHSVYFERAGEFNRLVGAFLEEVDSLGGRK